MFIGTTITETGKRYFRNVLIIIPARLIAAKPAPARINRNATITAPANSDQKITANPAIIAEIIRVIARKILIPAQRIAAQLLAPLLTEARKQAFYRD